jgi:FG-GAP-like repeat
MANVVSRCSAFFFFCLLVNFSAMLLNCGGGGTSQSSGGGGTPIPPSVNYAPPLNIASGGTHAGSLAIADFNGDGKLDIAVSNFSSNTIAVFLNQGAGTFAAPILNTIQIPNGLGPVILGDFNEDGKPDLVVGTIAGPEVALVLLGNGDGTLTQSASIPNSFGFFHGRAADLNGDKHLDYIGCGNGNMQIALGNGDGTFQAVTSPPPGPFPNVYDGCDVGYFDSDKNLDILAGTLRMTPTI